MFRLEKLEIHGFKSFADKTNLVFGEGITGIVGPNGCGKCVTGDTLVTLANGRDVAIREIVEASLKDSSAVEFIDDGIIAHDNPQEIKILSLNLNTLRLEPRPVKAFIKRTTTPCLLRVRTHSGREVTATPYHPLFTLENGRLRTLKAEELVGGIKIALPRRLPVTGNQVTMNPILNQDERVGGNRKPINFPTSFTPDLARFLGLLIAEGRNTNANQVWFVNSDEHVVNEYERLANSLFGLEVHRYEYRPKVEDALVYSKTLCQSLEHLFNFPINSVSAEKEFPPQVFEADEETQWAFLSGLFEGDAYISGLPRNGNYRPPYIEYVSASKKLAQQVVSLLLRLGVFTLLRAKEKYASNTAEKRRRTYYSVYIYGTEQLRYVADNLSFAGEKSHALHLLKNLPPAANPNQDLIPGITPLVKEATKLAGVKVKPNRHKHPKLAAYVGNMCEVSRKGLLEVAENIEQLGAFPDLANAHVETFVKLSTSDIYWDRITSVERVEPTEDWVYDLSVDVTHNFVAGNIIVHNSNVSEAISWVLGEQSAKSLRGGKMEDVIFNGTRDRKPTGMAEVILTMVATQDITSRNSEDKEQSEESEYLEALENAERAAVTARTLVQEFTPKEEDAAQPGEQPGAEVVNADSGGAPLAVQAQDGPSTGEAAPPQIEENAAGQKLQEVAEPVDAAAQAEAKSRAKRPKKKAISVMAGERITIARRLYRSGESDYFMNGRHCLLRDIQDLFAGTGLGGAHYAIIEQGRIGQILSSKPLDRRALIEEAAGITKFKARKRTTELRLESARVNLTRLNDIISEVERQVNSLKRQAQKARRYKRLREEMRALQRFVFAADYRRLQEANERVTRDLEATAQEQRELDAQLAELETEYQVVAGEARVAEDRLAELKERAATIALQADRARNQRAFDTKQIEELKARIERLKQENETLETRLTHLDGDKTDRVEQLKTLETELSAAQIELREHEEQYHQETARLREAEAEIESLRQQMLREISATERLKNLSASLEESLRKLELRQTNLGNELEKTTTRRDEAAAEYARVGDEIEGGRLRIAELSQSLTDRATVLSRLRTRADEQLRNLNQARTERGAAEQRLKSLEDLDSHHAYYSDTVQQILSPEQAAKINALGTLADFVNVEPQYEKLLESLFNRELQCVMVPTIDDALAGVEFIKASGLGRGAFLVVGLHGGEDDDLMADGGWQMADSDDEKSQDTRLRTQDSGLRTHFQLDALTAGELLGLRSEIRAVVERAFPAKCGALVSPDMEAALHLSIENPSRVYVTPEGEQVVNGRLIITNGIDAKKGTSLLALKRDIRELKSLAEELLRNEEAIAASLTETQKQIETTDSEKNLLDSELRQNEREAAARDSHFQGLARELDRAKQYVRVVETEIEQATGEHRELKSRIENLNAELQAAEESRNAVQQAVTEKQATFVEMRTGAEAFSERLSSLRASVAAQAERLQAARAEMRRLENETEELHSRINHNRVESYESHNRIEQLSESQAEGESTAQQLDSEHNSLAETIAAATETLKTARERTDTLDTILRDVRPKASRARDERSHLEVELARVESEAEHLARTCFSELAITLDEVLEQWSVGENPEDAPVATIEQEFQEVGQGELEPPTTDHRPPTTDLEAAKARLDELRVKLDDIGPVNMMALEELEEADERFKFLSEQRRDILDSIRLTEEALAEIKRRSRERFRHAFTHINQNFQSMFVELFGGGRGEMILIDEEDVLESGIDIIAQPPGKRLQSVLLLSGGEKAMSAIALVLAIFQYKPSPFCILDEVDAPLDEMNVGRFAGKVMEMSQETQFLVITHNKRTMESAKALYGVTMEEPGISKLVSVKFE